MDGGASEVLGDGFEFAQGVICMLCAFAYSVLKTVLDMVVNQGLFGIGHGAFYGLQLLGDIKATAPLFEHGDDALEVAFGTLEALDNVGVRGMCAHGTASYRGDVIKQADRTFEEALLSIERNVGMVARLENAT
jgi:hypothetical protein